MPTLANSFVMVSMFSDVPEPLYDAIQSYLTKHPGLSCDDLVSEAIALWLSQRANPARQQDVFDVANAFIRR
jgi:hypothetical protein